MGAPTYIVDERLKEFGTQRQCEYVDAVNKHRSQRAAARALGVNKNALQSSLRDLTKKAAIMGYSPRHDMTRTVPEPFIVRGVSTYYDKEGKAAGQWVKSRLSDDKAIEVAREAVRALSEDVRGMAPITPAPAGSDADLLAVYPQGDPHWGLLVWARECNDEAFDLDIARAVTLAAVDRLVATAPAAETAILLPLGDTLHVNDGTNQTPQHKHHLSADGRFVKMLGVCIEAYRHCVIRLLEKHSRLIVRFVQGNHDPEAIWSLAFTIAAYFSNDTRVTVDLSPSKHWFYRFGNVLIGATHGDTVKHDQLLGVMAADRAEDWGQTKHRYWYTGHVHSQSVREYPGVLCESFRTLAANDAYASSHGYRSGRDMKLIIHHREHGEIERHRVDIGMLPQSTG